HEFPEGFRPAETPEDGCFIEACNGELARVQFAVPHTFIVRQIDAILGSLLRAPDERQFYSEHSRVSLELLPDSERGSDQAHASRVFQDEAFNLELLDCLSKSKTLKQRAPAAADSPLDRFDLVRLGNETRLRRLEDFAWVDRYSEFDGQ